MSSEGHGREDLKGFAVRPRRLGRAPVNACGVILRSAVESTVLTGQTGLVLATLPLTVVRGVRTTLPVCSFALRWPRSGGGLPRAVSSSRARCRPHSRSLPVLLSLAHFRFVPRQLLARSDLRRADRVARLPSHPRLLPSPSEPWPHSALQRPLRSSSAGWVRLRWGCAHSCLGCCRGRHPMRDHAYLSSVSKSVSKCVGVLSSGVTVELPTRAEAACARDVPWTGHRLAALHPQPN